MSRIGILGNCPSESGRFRLKSECRSLNFAAKCVGPVRTSSFRLPIVAVSSNIVAQANVGFQKAKRTSSQNRIQLAGATTGTRGRTGHCSGDHLRFTFFLYQMSFSASERQR